VHLHIPDGVLPLAAWGPGLALALLVLVASARGARGGSRLGPGYQGALGALMLAAMAVEIPLGPLEYHLTLIGPVGVLLGAAGAYQAIFVVNLILAFVGHGGFTVVGLNALVPAGPALAASTALAHVVSGALWLALVAFALRLDVPASAALHGRLGILAGLTFPMWLLGIVVESAVAYGTARFVMRVRPDLLPVRTHAPRAGEAA
jgi:ABC-type Co2+ transport system permease subunit